LIVETNISKILSNRITQVVIILVLVMLFCQPLFSLDTYFVTASKTDQGIMFMRDIYDSNVSWSAYVNISTYMIQQASKDPIYPLVYFQGPDYTSPVYTQNVKIWQQEPYITDLRYDEYSASIAESATG